MIKKEDSFTLCTVDKLQKKTKMCQGRFYWAVLNLQNHNLGTISVEWNCWYVFFLISVVIYSTT
jgi:hypothetical protein